MLFFPLASRVPEISLSFFVTVLSTDSPHEGVRQILGEWTLTVTRPAGAVRPSSRRTSR